MSKPEDRIQEDLSAIDPTPDPQAPVAPEPTPVPPQEPAPAAQPVAEPQAPQAAAAPAEGSIEWHVAENNRLRQLLNESFGATAPAPVPMQPQVSQVSQQPAVQPQTGDQWIDVDFIGNEPLDKLLDTREGLNALLNAVAKKGYELAWQRAHERTLMSIPDVVTNYVTNMATQRAMHDEFYSKNTDLVPYKRVCAGIANKLSSEHPDWTVAQVFEASAVEARKTLGLIRGATTNQGPALVLAGVVPAKAGPSLTGLEKEVNDLLG